MDAGTPDGSTITNNVSVRGDQEDLNPANNSDSESTLVIARADMELVSKTESHDPAYAGETLTYMITARNNGPSTAVNARVVDVLPPGLTHVSNTDSCSGPAAGPLTCSLGTMPPGDTRTFTITVFIARDLVYNNGMPITVTNTATADSDTEDPNPGNDTKTEQTLVKAKADLEIVSFDPVNPPTEILVGDSVQVTVRKIIRNNGPSAPMDVLAAKQASVSGTGTATVTPPTHSEVVVAVGYQENRTHDERFVVTCTGAGTMTFTFVNDISPARPDDIDPNLVQQPCHDLVHGPLRQLLPRPGRGRDRQHDGRADAVHRQRRERRHRPPRPAARAALLPRSPAPADRARLGPDR